MARFNYRQSDEAQPRGASSLDRWAARRPELPYLLPLFVFVAFMLPAQFGHLGGIDWTALWKQLHPLIYFIQTVAAAAFLWLFWPYYTPVRWTHIPAGIVAGLIGTLLWIAAFKACVGLGLSHAVPASELYNPDIELHVPWQRLLFLCVRVAGPTLVVPLMEELFFRDFLTRAFVLGGHFQDVPIGKFTWLSLLATSAAFAINHGMNMLLPGFLYGLLMGVLLIRTKSLGACMTAHGLTNLTLYLYVIYTGDWQFM